MLAAPFCATGGLRKRWLGGRPCTSARRRSGGARWAAYQAMPCRAMPCHMPHASACLVTFSDPAVQLSYNTVGHGSLAREGPYCVLLIASKSRRGLAWLSKSSCLAPTVSHSAPRRRSRRRGSGSSRPSCCQSTAQRTSSSSSGWPSSSGWSSSSSRQQSSGQLKSSCRLQRLTRCGSTSLRCVWQRCRRLVLEGRRRARRQVRGLLCCDNFSVQRLLRLVSIPNFLP